MKVKILLTFVLSVALWSNVFSNIYTVNKADGNLPVTTAGSFKKAISDAASPGRDTIRFNVPGDKVTLGWGEIEIPNNASDLYIDGVNPVTDISVTLNLTVRSKAIDVDFYGVKFLRSGFHALIITKNNNSVDSCFFTTTGIMMISLWISNGDNTNVTNSVFNGSEGHAISIQNGGEHTIDNCTIIGVKDVAIIIRGTGDNIISNCSISDGWKNGVGLLSPNNIVEYCSSFDNGWSGISSITAMNSNIIRFNEVYNNNQSLNPTSGITPTLLSDANQGGIYSDGPNAQIYENFVFGNLANGIIIHKSSAKNTNVRNNIVGTNSDGDVLGNGWNGIFVREANKVNIESNTIINNGYGDSHDGSMPELISGIRIQGLSGAVNSGTIYKNYIGTDSIKTDAGNAFDGITLHTNVTGFNVTENIICYNGFKSHPSYGVQGGGGIALRFNSGNNVVISSNFIGVHEDLSDGGNKDYGISAEGAKNLRIGGNTAGDGNVIGNTKNVRDAATSHHGCGIWLVMEKTINSEVYNNEIIDNGGPGILIDQDAGKNIVGAKGKGNSLVRNEYGIMVTSSGAIDNTLRYNSFSCNSSGGISLQNGGNEEYGNAGSPKSIIISTDEPRVNYISGFAPSANAIVDIYGRDACFLACTDSASQGITWVDSVIAAPTASSSGLYKWEYDFVSGGNKVDKNTAIVLATEEGSAGSVNTSEFSICHFECDTPTNSQVNSPDFNLCPGDSTVLTANSFGVSSLGYVYDWYLGSIDSANLIHSAFNDSTYSVGTGGDYFVVISNITAPTSCADTSTSGTVVQNLNPIIDLVPSSASLCSGGAVNIDANASPSLIYAWTPGSETDPDIDVTSGGDYGVTVTNAAGCDTSADVTIKEFEISDVSISSADLSICPRDTAVLTANATDLSPTDGYTYTWYLNSIGSGSIVNTSSEITYSTTLGGDYIVVISNDESGGECADTSASVKVVENLNPIIDLVPSSNSLCSGGKVNIDANASIGLIYDWTPGGETDPDIDVTSGGDYGVTVTNAAGCDTSADVTVTEFEISTDLVINSSDLSLCPEETGTLTAKATGLSPTDDYTYTWYINSIDPGNVVNTSISTTFNTTIGGDYIVVVSNDASGGECADTSASVEVVQNLRPIIDLVASSISLCSGGTVNIDANASSSLDYSWTPGEETDPDIDITSGGDYGVTVTNAAGCDTSAAITITEFEISDDLVIDASTLSLCRGEEATLTAVATGLSTTDTYTYTWYLNSIAPENVVNTSNETSYTTGGEGDYIVVVSNDASGDVCSDTSAAAAINVNNIPEITLLPYTELCSGDTIDVEVDVTDMAMDILWAGGESGSKIRVFSGGEYNVTVKDPTTECDTTAIADIVENSKPEVSMEDITFCQEDSVLISAGISDMEYSWTPTGETVESFYIYTTDTLTVEVTDPVTGCFTTDTVNALQSPEPKPLLDLPNDSSMCPSEGDEIEINVLVTSELSGVLTWSNGTIDENSIIANDTIDYWTMFVDSFGCEAADTMRILGECIPPEPDLPNVMTKETPWRPIGDITPQQVLEGNFVLYNRWGRVIFTNLQKSGLPEWKGYNDQGVECAAGVYFWTWDFEDNNYKDRFYNGYVQKLDMP